MKNIFFTTENMQKNGFVQGSELNMYTKLKSEVKPQISHYKKSAKNNCHVKDIFFDFFHFCFCEW